MSEPDEIHSCSYYCARPECVREQRDVLRAYLLDVPLSRQQIADRIHTVMGLSSGRAAIAERPELRPLLAEIIAILREEPQSCPP